MVQSPRKRLSSPRKRLPPTPFNQTWHETDTAHLDPSALPVARIPRGWERKREIKHVSDGKAKSIWRRISLRSGNGNAEQEDETEEDHEVESRAVKRRQRMSPKAMEKLRGKKRAFQGTQWEIGTPVRSHKRSTRNSSASNRDQSDSDDAQDATDADMSHDSLAEAPQTQESPIPFNFAIDAGDTTNDENASSNALPEDSTFALIFKSPVKGAHAPLPRSERLGGEEITITGPTVESVVAEVMDNVASSETYVSKDESMLDGEGQGLASDEPEHIDYPELPTAGTSDDAISHEHDNGDRQESEDEEDSEMSEVDLASFAPSAAAPENEANTEDDESHDTDVTEASLQLDIQDEYEREGELASQPPTPGSAARTVSDITDGLTLATTPAGGPSKEQSPKRLHSPPPPLRLEVGPEDATMTLAIDDDTALLKSFLSRAAASKAERSAIITRRSSLENRRDSDIVRHALASPRRALEEKDPNSPTKIDNEATLDVMDAAVTDAAAEESASPSVEQAEGDELTEAKAEKGSRRSSRTKKSRLPAPATTTQPQTNKIAIRRADGTDPVILKKTDAQELALITRNNTRKNKQGAFMVSLRLLKLQAEAILSPTVDLDADAERPPVPGRRGIRWDETLAYYQEHADSIVAQQAEAESLATPDELSLPGPTAAKKSKAKTPADKNSTPKVRRVRGLGTANGTPGKGLLSSGSLLPDAVQEEKAAAAASQPEPAPPAKSIPKPKAAKKLPVPSAPATAKPAAREVAAAPVEPVKERKSRIAPPKSVRLPKPVITAAPAVAAEKENARTGISGATPRKGIPAPRIVAPKPAAAPTPAVGVESGLPRRRGRKI
ncbi:hypothetical protein E8E13_010265 [Curvularia kusanoi]|uniref:Uncharacterized protein n=1 Tax=Curvularia kusanoi TaxID=90978 RepID=A0A9P4TK82_CURKU|nr:hypothetical protein E8E13_010265 [Curvularia kusanoi]